MSIEADEAMIVIDALELSLIATEAVIRQLTANLAEGHARGATARPGGSSSPMAPRPSRRATNPSLPLFTAASSTAAR